MSNSKQPWLLIFSCYLLCPLYTPTHSTPVVVQQQQQMGHGSGAAGGGHSSAKRVEPCAHASIAELIKTSPVILKALGARIFTDDDLNAQTLQNGQKYFLTSAPTLELATMRATKATSARTRTTTTKTKTSASATSSSTWNSKSAAQTARDGIGTVDGAGRAGDFFENTPELPSHFPASEVQSILITLTPETIYKGASLLKMTPSAESAARSGSASGGGGGSGFGGGSSGGGSGNAAESARQYEGQLNATLEPLACFDGNVLKILPTELIAFGKLVTMQQQQQQQQDNQQHPVQQSDILRISINGLHRWSPQFENHIWKHLGWDDWSDFTVCSVTCSKGVQQRFRRCLLDNPTMVNLNMNMNLNLNAVDEDDNDVDDVADDDTLAAAAVDDVDNDAAEENAEIANELQSDSSDKRPALASASLGFGVDRSLDGATGKNNTSDVAAAAAVTAVNVMPGLSQEWSSETTTTVESATKNNNSNNNNEHDRTETRSEGDGSSSAAIEQEDDDVLRVFVDNLNESTAQNEAMGMAPRQTPEIGGNMPRQRRNKRRKSAKSFSTMFCEGYNIEQRNCNTFECSDDISDLLKFYKKFLPLSEDTSGSSSAVVVAPTLMVLDANAQSATTTTITNAATQISDVASSAEAAAAAGGIAASNVVAQLPSSTPANMGYVRSWRNALNFTLMLTLRIKNDSISSIGGDSSSSSSRTTASVFSIRNATHNLYLEPSKDGLRLYLERDNTTEMLPVKFNLYDYRWHQVAISIQNGDFISIYVDCSWTNSFVVSKRLFSLPLDADVEIGRGFNGELQQLLVLPDNQERQQCSNRRTSINEVKRYIIDTFIDDYGN